MQKRNRLLNAAHMMILSFVRLILICIIPTSVLAVENSLELRIIQSGHSLTDPIIDPLRGFVSAAGNPAAVISGSTIPGSPMDWRWKNPPGNGQPDARHDIADYDVLILTERVSLSGTMPWHNSKDEALRWFTHAWSMGSGGKGAETVLYATWVSTSSGPDYENPYKDPDGLIPFRERLTLEMEDWEAIRTYVNANRPNRSPEMRMIPGPLLMAAIYDEIAAGRAPGLNHVSDLFSDDIHLNGIGAYYIALAHFAVIYGLDPRGLPNRVGVDKPPSIEQARWLQELAWRVLSNYDGAGLKIEK